MTANKTYLSTYFSFKTSLLIKCMSLINKVNFKKCFSKNYKRMRLTNRVYGSLFRKNEASKMIFSSWSPDDSAFISQVNTIL